MREAEAAGDIPTIHNCFADDFQDLDGQLFPLRAFTLELMLGELASMAEVISIDADGDLLVTIGEGNSARIAKASIKVLQLASPAFKAMLGPSVSIPEAPRLSIANCIDSSQKDRWSTASTVPSSCQETTHAHS